MQWIRYDNQTMKHLFSWRHIKVLCFEVREGCEWGPTREQQAPWSRQPINWGKPTKSSCKTISVTIDMATINLLHTLRKLTKKPHHGACWPYCCNARNWAIQREFQVIIGLILLKLLELCKKTATPHYSWKLHHPGGYKQFVKSPNALAGWDGKPSSLDKMCSQVMWQQTHIRTHKNGRIY